MAQQQTQQTQQKDKAVLAYSGGLDTSVCIKWLQEEKNLDVIAVVGDVGQEHEGLEKIKQKALKTGAVECLVVDMRDVFAQDFLSKALAAVFGLKENTVSSTFDSIIPSVGSKYDIGISSFTVTKERMEAVDFVTYFKAGSTFVVQKGNPNKVDSSNLCGVKVAVQTGTTQEEEVNKANEQCKADGKDAIDIQSSKLQTDVTTAVASGKADIFYADTPVAGYAIKQTGDTLEALGEDVGVTPEAVAVKKGDSKTAEAVQKAIQKLMDDGTYKKILDTWGVSSGAVDKAEINPSIE